MTSVQYRTERVDSDSGGEGCSIFYLEVTGEAVLIRKNRGRRNAISIYIPVANYFTMSICNPLGYDRPAR